ncbi:MAG TPA: transporter [Vicinamibacterales bacterium]|nr:transporter [Vicinamibacterales bacterium]
MPALFLCLGMTVTSMRTAAAQELDPRAYTAAPIGVNFLVIAGGRSTGGVVVDPSLQIDDVEATIDSVGIGLGRTVDLFGRTALILAVVPYAWGDVSGSVGEESRRVTRSGLADPRVKLSVNLIGGRALTPREFAGAARPTIVGVSLAVAPPLGQYTGAKLINLGANRWAFKPEIGVSHALGRWTIEGYSGVVLFTTNREFYTGASVREQASVVALQAHVSYTLRRQLWAAFDATWYSGGTTTVNGTEKADLQRNSRVGATLSFPVGRRQSIKFSGSTGATTRIGADFHTFGAAWQLTWFD